MNIACISSECELEAILKTKEFNPDTDNAVLLNSELQEIAFEKKINFFTPKCLVSEKQRKSILKKAVSLAEIIEKTKIEYKGISLVKAKSYELSLEIYNDFFEAVALKNACKKFLPKKIIACRNTKAEKYLEILGKKACLLDLAEAGDSGFVMAHFKKRGSQISKKIFEITKSSFRKNKPNAITIFTKSRGYFDGLQKKLAESRDFNVFSIEEVLLRHALKPENWFSLKKMPQRIEADAKKVLGNRAIKNGGIFEKTNFFPIIKKQIENSVKNDFPRFVQFIDIIEKEFIEKKPKLVVLWVDSVPFERIVALMAKRFSATSIVIEHGVPSVDRTTKKGWLTGFVPLVADLFFAWGKNTKKLLKFHKIPDEKIFETGNPRFEQIVTKKFNREETRKKLGIEKNEKAVLVLTQPMAYGFNPMQMVRETIKAIEKKPLLKCIIKIHPVEHFFGYEKRFAKKAAIPKKIPLHDLIDASDAVVGNCSTTLLEAMLFEKPVIVFDHEKTADFYKKNNAVLYTRNSGELEKAINSVFENSGVLKRLAEGRKNFIKNELEFVKGSSEKTIELLKKLAKN